MPTSFHGQISTILDFILKERPRTILDVGIGFGKYGVLCREFLDIMPGRYEKKDWQVRIDGIEGFSEYRNPIHDYVYDRVYYGLIQEVFDKLEVRYDFALMIDVLEHFNKEEGYISVNGLLKKCRLLLISVPAIPCDQSYLSNELEKHRSIWKPGDFKRFKVKRVDVIPMTVYNSAIIALLKGEDEI
ncbi:MAG: hypothetical protein HPY66_1045 [Firmicutes bacterium]|nr:hypothetical protein [Bacillota bacterium]MDI6706431.1 hypothetical protein [Bacillota bacterium]